MCAIYSIMVCALLGIDITLKIFLGNSLKCLVFIYDAPFSAVLLYVFSIKVIHSDSFGLSWVSGKTKVLHE